MSKGTAVLIWFGLVIAILIVERWLAERRWQRRLRGDLAQQRRRAQRKETR